MAKDNQLSHNISNIITDTDSNIRYLYDVFSPLQRRHIPLTALILSVYADRLITIPFYQYEYNPFVLALGLYNWLLLTFILTFTMCVIWLRFKMYNDLLVRYVLYIFTIYHIAVITFNIWGIMSVVLAG